MRGGPLRKVVLSRSLHAGHPRARRPAGAAAQPGPAQPRRLHLRGGPAPARLRAGRREGHRTLVGASPELLVSRRACRWWPTRWPAPRRAAPTRSRTRRAPPRCWSRPRTCTSTPSWSTPCAEALRTVLLRLDVPATPTLVQHGHHVAPVDAGYRRAARTRPSPRWTLAAAMHPTPAVCGYPTALAHEVIGSSSPSTAASTRAWSAGATPTATASGW